MTERNATIPLHDQEYWETWAEVLPAPAGTIFDAKSYNAWKLTQKEPLLNVEKK